MIHSKARTNRIQGKVKRDVLKGSRGKDLMLGLAGNDLLNGLSGDDTLDGGVDKVITTVASYRKPVNVELIEYVGKGGFTFSTSNDQISTTNGSTTVMYHLWDC